MVSRKRCGITDMILRMPCIKLLLYCMSRRQEGGYLFGWLLFDSAGPIIINTFG